MDSATWDGAVAWGSREYLAMLALLLFARGADFFSTWVATPRLVLEGNPIARWLGWRWGLITNLALVAVLARWPLAAIVVSTASVLVAARNFQSAWLMRSMGEEAYRAWFVRRLSETRITLYLLCLAGNTVLMALLGGALLLFSVRYPEVHIAPLGIGMGMIAYALAVVIYTLLALWRTRRRERLQAQAPEHDRALVE
jgi:hypothetical protein